MTDDGKRIELVLNRQTANRTSYVGLGLLISLIVGYGPLTDALFGHGSFEGALGRFVACVAVCVVGVSSLGRLLDSAPRVRSHEDEEGTSGLVGSSPPDAGDRP